MPRSSLHTNAWLVLLLLVPMLSGCELVGDIFKLGVWSGVIIVGILALVAYVIFSFFKRT